MKPIRHAPCLTEGCTETTATRCVRRKLRCVKCRLAMIQNRLSRRGRPKKVRPEGWTEAAYVDDPPELIELNYQLALAEIKQRPRPEPVIGWESPLAKIC